MGTEPIIESQTDSYRYEALVRISEAIAACREPKELATTLADEIGKLLNFDHLYFVVVKQNSQEIEYLVWGKGPLPFPELPIKELLPLWDAVRSSEPQQTANWDTEARYPRFKPWAKKMGLGSGVRIPLATPHRQLGVFGLIRDIVNPFSDEEISFLRLIGHVIAFALDDGLNLRCARRQNERLKLLLNLTSRITSTLKIRDLLRAIAANIRQAMHGDFVAVLLLDSASGKSRLFALDFPQSKGFIREDDALIVSGAGKRALETLKPVIVERIGPDDLAPEMYEKVIGEGLRSICVIPLVSRDRALGCLSLARTTEASFAPEDVEFLAEAAGQIAIAIENAMAYHEISELKDKLAQEKLYLEEEIRSEMNFENIIGNSPALKQVLELAEIVAPSDSTVLLLGETGTGKELIARAIHDRSRRKDRTFVKLNCAAIPTGLLESELFGHEKGAFTGAITQKVGRLELADQGTLFLDEVGDISIEIQPKLLRALQEREFERLGSNRTKKVDVRLVAATNRDLEKMMENREFRSDLYYRLNVFPIRIPPLRERPEDIPLLVRYFTQKYGRLMNKRIEAIPAAAMRKLSSWHWPGNIRELENFIERSVILTHGAALEAPIAELSNNGRTTPVAGTREANERDEMVRILKATNGRVAGPDGAAARMGLKRTTLIARMKKLGVDPRKVS